MRRRSMGAVAAYKAAVRKIRRDRAAGRSTWTGPTPGRLVALQGGEGQWRVFTAPRPGERSRQVAGPFDSRDDADEWIAECEGA